VARISYGHMDPSCHRTNNVKALKEKKLKVLTSGKQSPVSSYFHSPVLPSSHVSLPIPIIPICQEKVRIKRVSVITESVLSMFYCTTTSDSTANATQLFFTAPYGALPYCKAVSIHIKTVEE